MNKLARAACDMYVTYCEISASEVIHVGQYENYKIVHTSYQKSEAL